MIVSVTAKHGKTAEDYWVSSCAESVPPQRHSAPHPPSYSPHGTMIEVIVLTQIIPLGWNDLYA